jgi:hypothetical protein
MKIEDAFRENAGLLLRVPMATWREFSMPERKIKIAEEIACAACYLFLPFSTRIRISPPRFAADSSKYFSDAEVHILPCRRSGDKNIFPIES